MSPSDERLFFALADETRRRLLTRLAEHSPETASQLAKDYTISRQSIMKHLDVLSDAGLIEARTKGREKQYWLTPEPLEHVTTWIDKLSLKWAERLQRFKDLVEGDELL